jgi:hypothetical protein
MDSEAQQGKAGALPLDPIKSDARLRATGEAFKIRSFRNRGLGPLAPNG